MQVKIIDSPEFKVVSSESYNSIFRKSDGYFMRWGKTKEEDPIMAPGPEILDIEIRSGKCSMSCQYCYKGNSKDKQANNMTLSQFKTILGKMPKTLTQVALGITGIDTNSDFFPMMEYCRSLGVVPNYTTNGIGVTTEVAEHTAKVCGAVAVSIHLKEVGYNAIKKFSDAGMTQVNIHYVLSSESYEDVMNVMNDIRFDPRLSGLRALVLLAYKPKGTNAGKFSSCTVDQYKSIIDYAEAHNISLGFDSCSSGMVLKAYENHPNYDKIACLVEPCESTLFSSYCNTFGDFFPCSFTENTPEWETGISILNCTDFLRDVWNHSRTTKFRNKLLGTTKGCTGCKSQSICRACPIYNITSCIE